MRLSQVSNARVIQIAEIAAGIAIFIAPFRSSAGLRGAMLLLAGAAILMAYFRAGQLKYLLPNDKTLGIAVAVWLAASSIWSLAGPLPLESLSVVKRDVLTSVLAFLVFFALTRTRRDMMRWIYILVAGLLILTFMVVYEPFDLRASGPARMYIDVGWLTTWLVMVAPLLAIPAFPRPKLRRKASCLLIVALPCLIWSAWLSGNRVVWVCFAVVVLVCAAIARRDQKTLRDQPASTVITAGLLLVIGLFLFASMKFRADVETHGGTGPVAFILQDNRAQIWRVAWDMFCERPLLGYGYGNPEFAELFAAQFDPGWRHLFRHAHNVVLNQMLQMGVMGAVVIVLLFAALIRIFVMRARRGGLARLGGYCGVALVVVVILRNSTDDFFSRHAIQFFGAFCGMLLGLSTRRPPLGAGKVELPR